MTKAYSPAAPFRTPVIFKYALTDQRARRGRKPTTTRGYERTGGSLLRQSSSFESTAAVPIIANSLSRMA